jgi:hypothetical protein
MISVKLTYETGIGTLIQFILVSFYILISQLVSTTSSCIKGSNCITDLITSIAFFIVAAIGFGAVWLFGSLVQTRRSRRLARLLIVTEALVGLIALYSIKLNSNSHNVTGLIASFGMLLLAGWNISLAFRLMRSGGGRVVARQRKRHISED